MEEIWDNRATGNNCPFDNLDKEDKSTLIFIKQLSASSLYLDKNQTYRGHCVLIYKPRHIIRIDQLSSEEWKELSQDIYDAETAIYKAFSPDHINIESLGNIVPHLHWHIIPRYKDDLRWGGPIWTTTQKEFTELYLTDKEYQDLVNDVIQNLPVAV